MIPTEQAMAVLYCMAWAILVYENSNQKCKMVIDIKFTVPHIKATK
jgi:hypothetical protein